MNIHSSYSFHSFPDLPPLCLVIAEHGALMQTKNIIGFIAWITLVFIAASIGALASAQAGVFYGQLNQPSWAPPAWLFGPVWSVLYLMMGIAVWFVWRDYGFSHARMAMKLFLAQLVLNALWSWLFFYWHLGAFSCVEILLLWLLIIASVITFWRHKPLFNVTKAE